jgi:serine/threonine protein kinase
MSVSFSSSRAITVREQIGPYRIERVLGKGAMGIVYLGHHEVFGRSAAIKTLVPGHAHDAHLRQRLLAEARAQARLQHPNVVTLYEPVDANGEVFIAMEYVDGESLAARLARAPQGRMTVDEALPLFEQLLEALQFVHGQKIVHRDVKPSNVMVSSAGRVKLADFGLALLAGEPRLTASLRIAGTPQYMSPEQLQGKDLDHRTDIYSAALVLYRMLSGRAAFESKEYLAQIHERMIGPPDLGEIVPGIPASIRAAVGIALQLEPAERFQSAAELREELSRAAAGFFPALPPTTGDEPTIPAIQPVETLATVPDESSNLPRVVGWTVVAGCVIAAASLLVTHFDVPPPETTKPRVAKARPAKPVEPPFIASAIPEKKQTPEPPPRRVPPKTMPDLVASDDDAKNADAARRRTGIETLREEIRAGLQAAASSVAMKLFDDALAELDRLDRLARREPAELWNERDDIAHLRRRAIEGAAAERMQAELWQSRLREIETAIENGRFPEALGIAASVMNDPRTPPGVAARAGELLQKAKDALARTFQSDTHVGPTTNTIRKPSSPPRKDD